VKKKEVRKQGVASKARRAVTHDEFRRMQSILREKDDVIRRYGMVISSLLLTFQFNLIASRIDDSTTQFQMENLTSNQDFDFTLQSNFLNWSKNVREEP
jgi:hypothetical protein